MYIEISFLTLLTYLSYKLLRKIGIKLNLVDLPNSRSSHNIPTIRGFGIVIFVSIGITLLTFNSFLIYEHPYLLFAVLIVGLLGLVDDIKNIPPIIKILTLIFAFFFLYAEGFLIQNLGFFLGVDLELHLSLAIIFSLFSVIVFTNSFNLIDGLDGLSGSVAIIIFLSFLFIGIENNDKLLSTIPILFLTSLAVFLCFNWNPAKVFLGDSGSLMIGFVISILAIRAIDYIAPISILYIAALPILDTLFVITRRVINGVSPLKPDRLHLHHILLEHLNNNVQKTVMILAFTQIIFGIVGVGIIAKVSDSFLAFISFVIIFVILFNFVNRKVILLN